MTWYCEKFYTFLEIDRDGGCWMCCPAWLPTRIGNIMTDKWDDIWNGKAAGAIRAQVYTGDWNLCRSDLCPKINSDSLPYLSDLDNSDLSNSIKEAIHAQSTQITDLPTVINFSNDLSCTLQCPSCRVKKILHRKGTTQYSQQQKINDRIVELFLTTPTDRKFEIIVTGSGDPFASQIYREMLQNINGLDFPNLTVKLLTNGIMFTPKIWDTLSHIHPQLGNCRISFDAGTRATYEELNRVGGKWDLLLNNCTFLNEKTRQFPNFKLDLDFVVQENNYKEMGMFAELALSKWDNISSLHFSRLNDWQTWSQHDYQSRAVHLPHHPAHDQLLQQLKNPVLEHPKVFLGNMSNFDV
tara:strand:+ start:1549 stop:2610 length:1062 start_codon:yes stop_codon:yes gene_type:complete